MKRLISILHQRKKENQRGATAVEFAIVILVFITIVFGIIEFGLLMYNQHIVTNAGREGAREGIVYRDDRISYQEIADKIESWEQYIVTFGDKDFTVPPFDSCEEADELTITITYTHDFIFLPFQRQISSTTTMKCE